MATPEREKNAKSPSSTKGSPASEKKGERTQHASSILKNKLLWSVFGLAIVIIVSLMFKWSTPCECEINEKNFPEQYSVFGKYLKAIIKREDQTSNTLVLLHATEDTDIADCLAEKLANHFSCEKKNSKNYTVITPVDVNIEEDYGVLLERYRNVAGPVIVKNLNDIAADSAKIFHSLCDDVTLVNPPSLYIFTIATKETNPDRPLSAARNILTATWASLPFNILDPLLSRILSYVYVVQPERHSPCQRS